MKRDLIKYRLWAITTLAILGVSLGLAFPIYSTLQAYFHTLIIGLALSNILDGREVSRGV